jgi:hypothetical protein
MRIITATGLFAIAALVAGCNQDLPTLTADDAIPNLAHESNNRAELTGMQDGTQISGHAIINAIVNRGQVTGWRSTISVQGDLAAGTYTVFVNLNGSNQTAVCSFTVSDMGGRQGCSADTNLPGFNTVEVRDASGNIVASGIFDRRGGNRFD